MPKFYSERAFNRIVEDPEIQAVSRGVIIEYLRDPDVDIDRRALIAAELVIALESAEDPQIPSLLDEL